MRRRSLWVAVLLVIAIAGCTRAKPKSGPAEAPPPLPAAASQERLLSLEKPVFKLQHPASEGTTPIAQGDTFTVVVDNCAGDAAIERVQQETYAFQPRHNLDAAAQAVPMAPQVEQAAHAYLDEAYGLVADAERQVEGAVTLAAPAHGKVEYALRWDELGEGNALEVRDVEALLASLPVQVTTAAQLVVVQSTPTDCFTAYEASVNVPVVEKATAGEQAAEAEVVYPAPGSDEALNLVKDYLEALDQHDLRRAYGMLHEVYRQTVPLAAYEQGYAQLANLEVHGIEVMQVGKHHEQAEAILTMELEVDGEKRYSDWRATLDVVITRGVPPYQRSISNVRMQRVDMGVG